MVWLRGMLHRQAGRIRSLCGWMARLKDSRKQGSKPSMNERVCVHGWTHECGSTGTRGLGIDDCLLLFSFVGARWLIPSPICIQVAG